MHAAFAVPAAHGVWAHLVHGVEDESVSGGHHRPSENAGHEGKHKLRSAAHSAGVSITHQDHVELTPSLHQADINHTASWAWYWLAHLVEARAGCEEEGLHDAQGNHHVAKLLWTCNSICQM